MTKLPFVRASTNGLHDQRFYIQVAYVIVLITAFGFVQFTVRGFAHPISAPPWVHLHAVAMIAWLGLFLVQNHLVAAGNFVTHRQLGAAGLALAIMIVGAGAFTVVKALELHRTPPFFSPAYFLSLTALQLALFGLLISSAVVLRRRTEYHRRLMFGALIVICASPGLGRMLPMNILSGEQSEWVVLAFELVLLSVMMRHDYRRGGAIHPATLVSAVSILVAQLLPGLLAQMAPVVALATKIAG